MVVSKDSKRKRKESPLIESSPEMPKRTKIQAQRKFAQGQNAPTTSFNPTLTSSLAQNVGNSILENREPPTEILPNKRPKTDDFLTFLCFRGTSALPARLDFLNQQNTQKDNLQENSNDTKKNEDTPQTFFQKNTRASNSNSHQISLVSNETINQTSSTKKKEKISNEGDRFSTRKVFEAQTLDEKNCLKSDKPEEKVNKDVKRRSVRNKPTIKCSKGIEEDTTGGNCALGLDINSGQEILEIEKMKSVKKQKPVGCPKKRREMFSDVEKVVERIKKTEIVVSRTVKKRRQRETPIFVPSPEPTGRMTRQRAFFEPVKVVRNTENKTEESLKDDIKNLKSETQSNNEDNIFSRDVFDFSSEDEQPLSKSIKIKTAKSSATVRGPLVKRSKMTSRIKKSSEDLKTEQINSPLNDGQTDNILKKPPGRRPKNKKADEQNVLTLKNCKKDRKSNSQDKEKVNLSEIDEKKSTSKLKYTRKKKIPTAKITTDYENKIRMRPTRKTKEAAAIYMGIIGQKLQLAEFEDELSLNSFPELPNVKETEKMETELKKKSDLNKMAKQKSVKLNMKQNIRRGRPPKLVKKQGKNKKFVKKVEKPLQEELNAVNKNEKEDDEDFLLSEEVKETKRKLEKSFSDSDDEPLAIKLTKNSEKDSECSRRSDNLIINVNEKETVAEECKPTSRSSVFLQPTGSTTNAAQCSVSNSMSLNPATSKLGEPLKVSSCVANSSVPLYTPRQTTIKTTRPPSPIPPLTPSIRFQTPPTTYPPPIEAYPTPKINPNFLTPKFDRNLDRRVLSVDNSGTHSHLPKACQFSSASSVKYDMPPGKAANAKVSVMPPTSFNTTSHDPLKDEIGSILAANLMPSKEESGKIFGIASVSLAQSSGPDNTKCTLGKCGSIHKPVLGPVVPTESYLGEQLSSKERRKAKVNMTHEQIQKWLIECSSNPDEIQDDLDDDFEDNLRPNIYTTTPPPIRDDKESTSFSSSSKTTRDLGKSESAWSGKGPSLKATPVLLPKDENELDEISSDIGNKACVESVTGHQLAKLVSGMKKTDAVIKSKERSKDSNDKQEKIGKKNNEKCIKATEKLLNSTLSSKIALTTQCQPKQTEEPKTNIVLPQVPTLRTKTPTNLEKSSKKVLVYDAKLKERLLSSSTKKASTSYTFGAFSASNEKSIYSFDKEEDEAKICLSNPFKRHSRRESNIDADQDDNSRQNDIPGQNTFSFRSEDRVIENKLVKASTESEQSKPIKSTDKFNELILRDVDTDIQTFYIPLQSASVGGSVEGNSDLIQGVAVKLGREGPEGPNQKVIMHATLVTKTQMGPNSKPLPEFMNVSEIVKSLLVSTNSNKVSKAMSSINTQIPATPIISSAPQQNITSVTVGSCKGVPIGTVQPRFKSTEPLATQLNYPSGSGTGNTLTRVNSNSSLFSGSNKSRSQHNKKIKDDVPIKMCNNTAFPRHDDPTQMVEAPIFRPSEKEFSDPIEFIDKITPIAARFGICKIIPPSSFKPECRVSDDMRFTAYNQYIHKMLHRWGPNVKEMSAIKKYLSTQSIVMNHPPWIGGMEVDLPRLYHTVQELGGLKDVIEKKKWVRVAEEMCIPKLAQDRVTKLDDIYCKYLLPYDTLSPNERQKLFDEVEADWAKREARARRNVDRLANTESMSNEDCDISSEEDEESEEEIDGVSMECIVKGRSMPLSQFYRIARNTMSLWFKNVEPSVNEVEAEFWRHVAVRDSHVCVHSGSIDSSGWGYGFPSPGPKGKGSACARHPWNLKVLTNNPGSVLRSLGPVMGVTVPTLHVGMLFSACCWYRDPHGLSWIEYLHTGASKLWYGIPDDQSANFRAALTSLIPTHCQNKTIWLPCDTVMVPPHMLTDRGVSLCRIEQKPGEYVVIFPRAYTSSIATGYVISESVYFATSSWLELGKDDFRDIHDSCEPAMFSLEQLLFALASDQRVAVDILHQTLPMINEVFEKEVAAREQLQAAGVISTEKVVMEKGSKSKKTLISPAQNECDVCRANLYISMIKTDEGNIFCLQHALKNLNKGNISAKQCKLIFSYNIEDIENIIKILKERLIQKRANSYKKSK